MPGAVAADDGGMTDRFALVRTGLLLALLLAPLPATADQDADARAALARYVEVTGGRAAFLGDTSVHVRGRLADASLGGRFESWAAWPARYAQTEQLGTIRARTLVLVGDSDNSTKPAESFRIWRAIPAASLVVIPGCSHGVHMEDPATFNRVVGDFLLEPRKEAAT